MDLRENSDSGRKPTHLTLKQLEQMDGRHARGATEPRGSTKRAMIRVPERTDREATLHKYSSPQMIYHSTMRY